MVGNLAKVSMITVKIVKCKHFELFLNKVFDPQLPTSLIQSCMMLVIHSDDIANNMTTLPIADRSDDKNAV